MSKKREELLEQIWAAQDTAYDLMSEYDSLPHSYGENVLYQAEAHLIDRIALHPGVTVTDLANMVRKTPSACSQLVRKLRDVLPEIALSTDIIVGFPGETAKDFEDTYRLVDEVGYHQVFTFIYSKREGTPAASVDDPTPRDVIQGRFDRLVDLVQKRAFEANQADLGSTVDVLVEGASKRDAGLLAGKSPKNQTVHAPVPAGADATSLVGRIVPVTIEEARTWYLSGTIVHA